MPTINTFLFNALKTLFFAAVRKLPACFATAQKNNSHITFFSLMAA